MYGRLVLLKNLFCLNKQSCTSCVFGLPHPVHIMAGGFLILSGGGVADFVVVSNSKALLKVLFMDFEAGTRRVFSVPRT